MTKIDAESAADIMTSFLAADTIDLSVPSALQLLSQACNIYETEPRSTSDLCNGVADLEMEISQFSENSFSGDTMTGRASKNLPSSNSTSSLSDLGGGFTNLLKISPSVLDWSLEHLHDNHDSVQMDEGDVDPDVTNSVDLSLMCKTKVKRKRNRRKQPNWTPPPAILPPCRICEDKSSGYHYGANTCEACKGFFRRTLKKKSVDFLCKCKSAEQGQWKRGPVKNGCPACRYERCLASGMSKNAIKIGRYTTNHKTENIKTVKSLESIDSMIQDAIAHAQEEMNDDTSDITFALDSPMPDQDHQEVDRLSDITEVGGFGLSLKEVDFIAKRCHDAHMSSVEEDPKVDEESLRREHVTYFRHFLLKQKIFGSLPHISREEYMDFFRATGIDVDGRQQFLQEGIHYMKTCCEQIVKFARSIPGFSELCIQDQTSLIKASRTDNLLVGFIRRMPFVSPELEIVTLPWGKTIHVNEIEALLPKSDSIERYKLRVRMNELELTDTEAALFRALLITMPDRVELLQRDNAEVLHEKLLSCLQHMLHVRPGGSKNLLYRLCDIAVRLRSVSYKDHERIKQHISDFTILSDVEIIRELNS